MNKTASILIVSVKGHLLMRRDAGSVTAFDCLIAPNEPAIKAAVRGVGEATGLEARADDLEFLDTYDTPSENTEAHTFILAGVDPDRLHVYGGELCVIRRADEFGALNLTPLARKQVIDYFKRHK